jgi:hypothetical protein
MDANIVLMDVNLVMKEIPHLISLILFTLLLNINLHYKIDIAINKNFYYMIFKFALSASQIIIL